MSFLIQAPEREILPQEKVDLKRVSFGRFTRHQMDRTAEVKELVARRREHFYEEALAASH